jgi:NAD-dependent SIR2 family protein deacetylase
MWQRAVIIFGLFVSAYCYADSDYFCNPRACSAEELQRGLKEKTLDMAWYFGEGGHFRFVSKSDEVYFEIYEFQGLVFSYRIDGEGEEINVPRKFERKTHPDGDSYLVTKRRIVEGGSPGRIDEEGLARVIKNHPVLFYTGAGLSVASNVPAMGELQSLLGLEMGENFLLSLKGAIENPREFASKIAGFHQACFSSAPNGAHFALKELADFKNIRLITENHDCLHEASGIYPYRINAKHLREEVGGESVCGFDYIICVGLSYDDRGFLAWYKEHNPEGKIIAIDLQQPSYLGDEDFLLVGDLQEVIPALVDRI